MTRRRGVDDLLQVRVHGDVQIHRAAVLVLGLPVANAAATQVLRPEADRVLAPAGGVEQQRHVCSLPTFSSSLIHIHPRNVRTALLLSDGPSNATTNFI